MCSVLIDSQWFKFEWKVLSQFEVPFDIWSVIGVWRGKALNTLNSKPQKRNKRSECNQEVLLTLIEIKSTHPFQSEVKSVFEFIQIYILHSINLFSNTESKSKMSGVKGVAVKPSQALNLGNKHFNI